MKVEVTIEHICNGERQSPSCCPITLALQDVGVNAFVWDFQAEIVASGVVYDLPDEAKRFIEWYDDGEAVTPFNFDIDIPEDQHHAKT